MATITSITILNRIGEPGAPSFLSPGELAYNQPETTAPVQPLDALYVGNGTSVSVLVGAARQLELWGEQTIVPGSAKTINVEDLKLIGGSANWLLQTDGNGNLSFTNAPGGGLTQVATDATLTGEGTTASPLSVVAHAVAVATDGVTIGGNGTTGSPLAVQGNTVSVATDGVTITGNGTSADPLLVAAHSVAVATTGATLTGNGTTASPLAVAPNTVAVATNSTLSGNGTTANPLGVVADSVPVATDGTTITGNGTTASPLTAMNGTVAVAVDGTTIAGEGITASPLHVLPNSVAVATSAPLTGNGTSASPVGLTTPLPLQYGGTGVNASSNATLLSALGAASTASLAGYLPLSGGTLTGALSLSGNATGNLQAVPLQQLNASLTGYLPLTGGSLSGALTISSGNLTLTNGTLVATAGGINVGSIVCQGAITVSGNSMSMNGSGDPFIFVRSAGTGVLWEAAGGTPLDNFTVTSAAASFSGTLTVTGAVTLTAGNATANLQAVPLQQVQPLANNTGRNFVDNALFNIQQRGTGPWTASGYTADRWQILLANDTASVTFPTMADSDRAAIGDEAATFAASCTFTGSSIANSYTVFSQPIESVRRLSGKTVTLSFWARATSGTPMVGVGVYQFFGSGGSTGVPVPVGTTPALSATWQRYSFTAALPSASGKTFGSAGDFSRYDLWLSTAGNAEAPGIGVQSGTVQFWGMQLEIGSSETPLAKLAPEPDLERCLRFFISGVQMVDQVYQVAGGQFRAGMYFPVVMRTTPTAVTLSSANGNLGAVSLGPAPQMCWVQAAASATGTVTYNMTFSFSADL